MTAIRSLSLQIMAASLVMASGAALAQETQQAITVFIVPNFHPASCGWLADWSTERNYCANSYLNHLDRVRDDSTYNFALSECNNLIAIQNFAPQRFEELKQRIKEGRVDLCNAFFLEPTISLSGGEALVKMGVEGLRWQQQMMGMRPRLSWMIDVTGVHEQMAQIVSRLGLDAFVYCRHNRSGSTMHWLQSPDGTRVLAISPGHYLEWQPMFGAKMPLGEKELQPLVEDLRARLEPPPPEQNIKRPHAADLKGRPRKTPVGAPVLIFGGSGDYSIAPLCKDYPALFLKQFKEIAPQYELHFSTPSRYLDVVLPGLESGAIQLPTVRGGTEFSYNAFWIQNPRVKSWYRRCEHKLQAAEMVATVASLVGSFDYPAQSLYHAWLQMLLNMDRNTLWGAAGGMVFEHGRSWDVRDRFESVERISQEVFDGAARALATGTEGVTMFNPLNWERQTPVRLSSPLGSVCQALPGGNEVLCRLALPPISVTEVNGAAKPLAAPEIITLPPWIETRHYRVRVDGTTGALTSVRLKSSDREILGGPANVIVAELPGKPVVPGDHMMPRPGRERLTDSNATASKLTVSTGPLATVVEAESTLIDGGRLWRQMIFYHDSPRIDFQTELNDIPDHTVVVAEFPLAGSPTEIRRGIPFGFSHGAWAKANSGLSGVTQGILPAVRWSDYELPGGGGVALLDRGLPGREINGQTPIVFLYNAVDDYRGYPNAWLSGKGRHRLEYALVVRDAEWKEARIPHMAWEYNCPPIALRGGTRDKSRSFLTTSSNVIVEAMRREGEEVEVRLVECLGLGGKAEVKLNLPHQEATMTDLTGGRPQKLDGGPAYTFTVSPQQIVTLRFRTAASVPKVKPLIDWSDLVPANKRAALHEYLPNVVGHPPVGK